MRLTDAVGIAVLLAMFAVSGVSETCAAAEPKEPKEPKDPKELRSLAESSDSGVAAPTATAPKKTKKKSAAPKMRVSAGGFIASGMTDAPSAVFGFGGGFAYRILRNIEAEASLTSFGYILDYAAVTTTVEITDMAINADGIYRIPLTPNIHLRGRGGAGMHIFSAKVAGEGSRSSGLTSQSKNILAINLGGGLEMSFGNFFIAADIRKPILMEKLEAVGDISFLICGEAGMRF